ncbi:DNA polymerase Y family protein [Actinomyces mediterranea]|uniref:DNA polymerase Y family protein n=1 Tax=Actinomyces mediterranea TaxID=1871028 RepID=UPI0009712AED|nr:DNA polymerase Y family protein [Actinomyces mediterranea]
MRLLVLWIPDWPVTCHAVDLPPGSAGAVVGRDRIEYATVRARRAGVRSGMKEAVARYLCPELICLPYDPDREGRAFNTVLDAFESVAAKVSCLRPGLAWAPAAPVSRWNGGEEAAARTVVEAITDTIGVECFTGIASGPLVGVEAARRGLVIPAKDTALFLADLPIGSARPLLPSRLQEEAGRVIEILATLGITTCADLTHLGYAPFYARFGAVAQPLWDLCNGLDVYVPARERAHEDQSVEVLFDEGAFSLDQILLPVRRRVIELAEVLAAKGLHSDSVRVVIELTNSDVRQRTWNGISDEAVDEIVDRVRWQFSGWLDARVSADRAVCRIIITALQPYRRPGAAVLWGPSDSRERVERTVHRIDAILGYEAVTIPHLQGGFDPRSRICRLPWNDEGAPLVPIGGEWEGSLRRAPAVLLDHPIRVDVLSGGGLVRPVTVTDRGSIDALPRSIRIREEPPAHVGILQGLFSSSADRGRRADIEMTAGPWAIIGRWWEEGSASRAYLTARIDGGGEILLVWRAGSWWIEGVYSCDSTAARRWPTGID